MSKIELYSHNQETYNKIKKAWETSNKVAVIQATGTGKSYLILKCLDDYRDMNKIILAPSNYILEHLEDIGEELPNTILMTYSKLSFMEEEEIISLNPSLIVLDEFHRCGAEQWGKGVNKLLNNFPNAKILGTSATPIRYLDNERDMSDELFDGNVVVNLSLAEAIIKRILPMPKYISALYSFDEEIKNLKNKIEKSSNEEKSKNLLYKEIDILKRKLDKSNGIPNILKKYITDKNGKYIVFCKDIKHLNEIKGTVIGWFRKITSSKNIKSYTIYTDYEEKERDFEAFSNSKNKGIQLLFCIDMLNEGVHIDNIKGVILLRPTMSPIIFYQQIGRAIDAGNKNTPLIFDFVNNFDNIGANTFINDLEKQKEKILKQYKHKELEIPEFTIYDEIQEVKELFLEIENKLLDNWNYWFEKLKEYYDKNGHVVIKNEPQLANWAYNQRKYYKKGILEKDKIEKLESINFSWEFINDEWENNYAKLKEYYNKFGNCKVSPSYDKKLSQWVKTQRVNYQRGKISQDRIEKLEKLNFTWNVIEDAWNENYTKLKEYYKIHGHCNIPQTQSNRKEKLTKWLSEQRHDYLNGKLSKEKIQKLEELNIIWNTKEEKWNKAYNHLIKYKEEFGNFNVPYNYSPEEGINLSSWIKSQRKLFKENKLSEEKIQKLLLIGFKFEL